MEDIKLYIESGILELYVLGDISPTEKLQVEEMIAKHPAVKAEVEEIEHSMESYALANAVDPADHLRDKVLNSLLTNFGDDSTFPSKKEEKVKDNIIAMPAPRANSFYKYAFAACLAMLIASVAVLINLNNRLQDANTQLVALSTQNQHFTSTVHLMDQQLGVYRDTSMKVITLKGTAKHPESIMQLAWNTADKKVIIDMGDLKLPINDQTHQYQLWAIVAGKPVDLGVFDKAADADSTDMKVMKSISGAQAFAVTLEPRGGSVNPTMDQMMVIRAL